MKIVLTHKSPDFDALASAYAALRLHGCDAVVVASGCEPNVDEYLDREEHPVPVRTMKPKEIEAVERVELVVITDCKLKSRLGPLVALYEKAERVVLYDHHPSHGKDIEADEEHVENVGAATTILANKLFDADIDLSAEEYGLFLLGIYEDTGFLTFSSTTESDLATAARLRGAGGDLDLVSEYVKRDMSKEQVFVLNELLMNISVYRIMGVSVGVSHASVDRYIGEIAYLAHKMMDMESLDCLFIMVRTGNRIVLVGRSKVDQVNAAEVVYAFGGGGHPTAASAIVKDMALPEAFEKLRAVIRDTVHPVKYASDIMTSPAKSITVDATFDDAVQIFMKYNLNMMPVTEGSTAVGLISRRDILQGIKHGLHNEPVSSIMQVEFTSVQPDTPYFTVEEIMLGANQKLVPVVKDEELIGVITRTDLLRMMQEEISRTPRYMHGRLKKAGLSREKNVARQMTEQLPKYLMGILTEIGDLAEKEGLRCYVVGGFVRDLIMGRANDDLDIVVEGDAPRLAKLYAKRKKGKASEHRKFKTAVVILPDDFRIDFATARTEYYNFPAAAPEVEDSSIRNDLYRRDFSVNAMAVKLNGKGFGTLLDFFGGQRDIIDRKIRVLHNLSFVDDPSRALRAIRFAVRFSFDIGPHTHQLIRHAVSLNLFDRINGKRLFTELTYILELEYYRKALDMMMQYDIISYLHNKVQIDETARERFETLDRIYGWYTFQTGERLAIAKSRFIILFYQLKYPDMARLAERFELEGGSRDELVKGASGVKNAVRLLKRMKTMKPSAVTGVLSRLSDEFVMAVGAVLGESFEPYIREYVTRWKHVELELDGNDVINAGYRPSSSFAAMFRRLRDAKLDGKVSTRDEEYALMKELMEELST